MYYLYGTMEALLKPPVNDNAREKFTGKELDAGENPASEVSFNIAINNFDAGMHYHGELYVNYTDLVYNRSFLKVYPLQYVADADKFILNTADRFPDSMRVTNLRITTSGAVSPINYEKACDYTVITDSGLEIALDTSGSALINSSGVNYFTDSPYTPERVAGSNLYYFGARYYDAELGVWGSTDPAEEYHNSYSYVGGDPVNATDPYGLWTIGFGLLFGYSKEHGFSIGFGMSGDYGQGCGDFSYSYNFGDKSNTFSASAGGEYGAYHGSIGGSYNSVSGYNLNASVGAQYYYVGAELGNSYYWNTNGDYQGGDVSLRGYVGDNSTATIGGGYKWGFGGASSGWFSDVTVAGQNYNLGVTWSQNGGFSASTNINALTIRPNQKPVMVASGATPDDGSEFLQSMEKLRANEGVEPIFGLSFGGLDYAVLPFLVVKNPTRIFKEFTRRAQPGKDGGISNIIKEMYDGTVNSVTHQVTKDGKIVHQHQTHIGKYGKQRQFPNEWIEYPEIK